MASKGWDKTEVRRDAGERVEAVAPVIISASRSTDIPAFFSEWLVRRLERGYVSWVNPFNRKPQYVSFAKARAFVFWSKNPAPLIPFLPEFDRRGIGYYFQFTLNDYHDLGLEPRVPPMADRLKTFRTLSERLGPDRVVWRFDPLLLAGNMTTAGLVGRVRRAGDALAGLTRKLVTSFADVTPYAKVRNSLRREKTNWREFSPAEMNDVAGSIAESAREWGVSVASCAEAVDLSSFGIQKNRCVDGALLARLFPHDTGLMSFLGLENAQPLRRSLFPEGGELGSATRGPMKDKGQREACGCMMSKDIGHYNTCGHLCVYCYANSSAEAVSRSARLFSPEGETPFATGL